MKIPVVIKNDSLSLSTQQFISFSILVTLAFLTFLLTRGLTIWAAPVAIIVTGLVFRVKPPTILTFFILSLLVTGFLWIVGGLGHIDCGDNCGEQVLSDDANVLMIAAGTSIVFETVMFFGMGKERSQK
ncbi:MAG TPA: hypothetical protein VLE69_02635 [Candidatus Saccharimonadales bacterium]|nr:hypothetical protein [Candidatus Saccharimonadales bacterium]